MAKKGKKVGLHSIFFIASLVVLPYPYFNRGSELRPSLSGFRMVAQETRSCVVPPAGLPLFPPVIHE
jgi:hypothetical protein